MKRALALGAAAFAAEQVYKRATALDLTGKRAVVTGSPLTAPGRHAAERLNQ